MQRPGEGFRRPLYLRAPAPALQESADRRRRQILPARQLPAKELPAARQKKSPAMWAGEEIHDRLRMNFL
jgi:hypothetical protein